MRIVQRGDAYDTWVRWLHRDHQYFRRTIERKVGARNHAHCPAERLLLLLLAPLSAPSPDAAHHCHRTGGTCQGTRRRRCSRRRRCRRRCARRRCARRRCACRMVAARRCAPSWVRAWLPSSWRRRTEAFDGLADIGGSLRGHGRARRGGSIFVRALRRAVGAGAIGRRGGRRGGSRRGADGVVACGLGTRAPARAASRHCVGGGLEAAVAREQLHGRRGVGAQLDRELQLELPRAAGWCDAAVGSRPMCARKRLQATLGGAHVVSSKEARPSTRRPPASSATSSPLNRELHQQLLCHLLSRAGLRPQCRRTEPTRWLGYQRGQRAWSQACSAERQAPGPFLSQWIGPLA